MKEKELFDVVIIGGGVAGSIAGKFCSKNGLKTLLIEKDHVPRAKACSGIQFKYFKKIIGEEIPPERLCNVQLNRVRMFLPNGKSIQTPFGIINFMRDVFDEWLNEIAQKYGTEFVDQCKFLSFEKEKNENFDREEEELIKVKMEKFNENKNKEQIYVWTKYLIDATGLRPEIRKILRPSDFEKGPTGTTLNYYIKPDSPPKLREKTLYQFWNVDWNDVMFAWIYIKTLNDGNDYWVVGTGCFEGKIKERQEKFYKFVQDKFELKGEIIKKEGYSSNINMTSSNRIWLGEENILMVGDAAGLVDTVRGVGMDAAALSGRLAARSIVEYEQRQKKQKKDTSVLDIYSKYCEGIVNQTRENQKRGIHNFSTNQELLKYLKTSMGPSGIKLLLHSIINKFKKPKNFVLLPP